MILLGVVAFLTVMIFSSWVIYSLSIKKDNSLGVLIALLLWMACFYSAAYGLYEIGKLAGA